MKCCYIKPNNEQCAANAMIGSKFCFSHNPETKEEKIAAVIKGGRASKKNHNFLPPISLEKPKDTINLITTTINEVRKGLIELKIANCIGYLSGHLIKAFEITDLEDRISRLEKAISKS